MAPARREVERNEGSEVDGLIGQVVAVQQEGKQRPFVCLDDLERWAADPSKLQEAVVISRKVYDSWRDKTGGVYVNTATL
jgi:hypothetical protein